jgi:hypothetical protein
MKKLFFIFITATVLSLACNKNNSGESTDSIGIITGRDLTKCYCCWGWFIEINNTAYMFDKIPATSTFDLTTITYPTTVKIKWRPSQVRNCSQFIDVLDISL